MRGVWAASQFFTAAVIGVSVSAGCGGSGKQLPSVVPENTDKVAEVPVPVPAKSEAAALAVVERALKTATDGNPSRIDRAKVNRLRLKGTVIGPNGPVKSQRQVDAVWPDRIAQTDEFATDSGFAKTLVRLRRPVLWVGRVSDGKATAVEFPDAKASEAAIGAEMVGRHWMTLLVPLTEAKTVVFDAKKQSLNAQPADVIRAAAPGSPVFSLWFDEKSGLLLQVTFSQVEPGNLKPTDKVFTLRDHRAVDGLMAPGRIEYRQGGLPLPLEEWTVDGWEFPERLDDTTFDAPR